MLELVPIIGPIISAVPAVLLAATVGTGRRSWPRSLLYLLVQQVENNFLVPKIQGDAVQLHPAAVIFAIIIGGALAGLLGAILALPITAAFRDVVRYLFRRLSPDEPEALAASLQADRDGPGRWLDRCLTSTRTRSCRSTPRPRTRSSRPPIDGSPANITPTWRRPPTPRAGWRRSTRRGS